MLFSRTFALAVVTIATILPIAAVELYHPTETLRGLNSSPPKQVLVLDGTGKMHTHAQEPTSHMEIKANKRRNFWQRIMASNIGMLPLFCPPPSILRPAFTYIMQTQYQAEYGGYNGDGDGNLYKEQEPVGAGDDDDGDGDLYS